MFALINVVALNVLTHDDWAHQMSTFSETGSFLMTSGAIQATVPANDIFVLLSLSSFEVPKSEIFTRSSCVINMLQNCNDKCLVCKVYRLFCPRINCVECLLWGFEVSMDNFV